MLNKTGELLIKIDIKPLSVNRAYKGRRFRTDEYDRYEHALGFLLPNFDIPPSLLKIVYEFGLSNDRADVDNPCKMFTDVLQKKYGFNDSRVYEYLIRKVIVPKGQEYVKFNILPFNQELISMN